MLPILIEGSTQELMANYSIWMVLPSSPLPPWIRLLLHRKYASFLRCEIHSKIGTRNSIEIILKNNLDQKTQLFMWVLIVFFSERPQFAHSKLIFNLTTLFCSFVVSNENPGPYDLIFLCHFRLLNETHIYTEESARFIHGHGLAYRHYCQEQENGGNHYDEEESDWKNIAVDISLIWLFYRIQREKLG